MAYDNSEQRFCRRIAATGYRYDYQFNIAFNANHGLLTTGAASLTHTYNLVFSNLPDYAGTSADATEISSDPLFVGGGDYHILAIFPAANAGTDSSSVTAVDIEGQPRPSGSGYEMGCDERNPPKFVSWREPRN